MVANTQKQLFQSRFELEESPKCGHPDYGFCCHPEQGHYQVELLLVQTHIQHLLQCTVRLVGLRLHIVSPVLLLPHRPIAKRETKTTTK